MSLLKRFVDIHEHDDESPTFTSDGKVPLSSIQFALDRIEEFVACRNHLDIDRDFPVVWDHEWNQFLTYFYALNHHNEALIIPKGHKVQALISTSKLKLLEATKHWPQFDLDGFKNIWILKPGNKCRGRGIQLVRSIEDVEKIMNLKLKYVVQKYIGERSLFWLFLPYPC